MNQAIEYAARIASIGVAEPKPGCAPTPSRRQRAVLAAFGVLVAALAGVHGGFDVRAVAIIATACWALCGFYGCSQGRSARRARMARLRADCDAQHAAWQRGDDVTAIYGRFRPPFVILHDADCTPGRCVCHR